MDSPNQAQAAQALRLTLDLMRLLAKGFLAEARFASNADNVLLLAAVWIGHAEGRPMAATKLAMYAGMSRPTAIRKLKELEALGIVSRGADRRYVPSVEFLGMDAPQHAIVAAVARLDAWGCRPVG